MRARLPLSQAGDGGQRREAWGQAVCGLANVFADGLGEHALEAVVAGAGAAT